MFHLFSEEFGQLEILLFSVRHWKSLVNYWDNSVLFVPLMLHN